MKKQCDLLGVNSGYAVDYGGVFVGGIERASSRPSVHVLNVEQREGGYHLLCEYCGVRVCDMSKVELMQFFLDYDVTQPLLHEECEGGFIKSLNNDITKKPPLSNRGVTFLLWLFQKALWWLSK